MPVLRRRIASLTGFLALARRQSYHVIRHELLKVPMTLQEAAADLVLTGGRPERMPDQAVAWMTEGYDSPALIELAGLNRNDDVNDLRTLYDRTLRELGVEPPSHLEAAQIIISAYATDVVEGRLDVTPGT
jgi:hypothetical protein